jgi:hypothetical protein
MDNFMSELDVSFPRKGKVHCYLNIFSPDIGLINLTWLQMSSAVGDHFAEWSWVIMMREKPSFFNWDRRCHIYLDNLDISSRWDLHLPSNREDVWNCLDQTGWPFVQLRDIKLT